MRKIGVVTVARSDYGSCRPILRRLANERGCETWLYVTGMHLCPEFGWTVREIEEDGFPIRERLEMLLSADSPAAVAASVGIGTTAFARAFARERPDLLLLVGDRTELLAPASAALPFRLPLAHLSGGEITEGATDDMVRHAVTKLSHLHFPTNEAHARRLRQLGEEDWRIHVTGDPALDRLAQPASHDRAALEAFLGQQLTKPVIVVTHHPVTQGGDVAAELEALVEAMRATDATWVITFPNADTGSSRVRECWEIFAKEGRKAILVANLGQERYYSLLAQADAMLGNSSSGIWESSSFELPAVNVGDRQKGRLRAANVIDAEPRADAVKAALRRALSPEFRETLRGMVNPYGDGRATDRIVDVVRKVPLGEDLLRKRFVDVPVS